MTKQKKTKYKCDGCDAKCTVKAFNGIAPTLCVYEAATGGPTANFVEVERETVEVISSICIDYNGTRYKLTSSNSCCEGCAFQGIADGCGGESKKLGTALSGITCDHKVWKAQQ